MHSKFDFEAVQARLSRWSDVALALAIVTVIALLVFRIDQHALDFFLAVNLAVSFVVLLAAVYASDATFPTLLLLTTLLPGSASTSRRRASSCSKATRARSSARSVSSWSQGDVVVGA
jgi:flagellar biosynthesis component FlhA